MKNSLLKKRDQQGIWPESVKAMDIQGVLSIASDEVVAFHLEHICEDGIDIWLSSMVEANQVAKVKFAKPSILEVTAKIVWCVPIEGGGFKARLEISDLKKLLV